MDRLQILGAKQRLQSGGSPTGHPAHERWICRTQRKRRPRLKRRLICDVAVARIFSDCEGPSRASICTCDHVSVAQICEVFALLGGHRRLDLRMLSSSWRCRKRRDLLEEKLAWIEIVVLRLDNLRDRPWRLGRKQVLCCQINGLWLRQFFTFRINQNHDSRF